ncbi:MAG: ribulose-phosphate 3-epimerase, partial [Buchnera aphidicola]|nr:ribulose-phosphate 3-epimerase [Buchnera aphidicola]
KAGFDFNPSTPLNFLDYTLDKLDMILLLSVNPGFSNQSFIKSTLGKLREVRKRIDAFSGNILLQVDGGIKIENISEIALAGANVFVIGSGLFQCSNYKNTI